MRRLGGIPEESGADNAKVLRNQVRVLELNFGERDEQHGGHYVSSLHSIPPGCGHDSVSLMQHMPEATNEHNRLKEQLAESLVDRLCWGLIAARDQHLEEQDSPAHSHERRSVPSDEHNAIVKDLMDAVSSAMAEHDVAFARILPLQLARGQILDLVDQVRTVSAISVDIFEDTVQQAHHYLKEKDNDRSKFASILSRVR